MSLEQKHKRILFNEILGHMTAVSREEDMFGWFVRDVNNEKNHSYIRDNYDYLRRHFMFPRVKRSPAKLTSQMLLLMARECNYQCTKKVRCYMIDTPPADDGKKKKRMKSTSVYVCVC